MCLLMGPSVEMVAAFNHKSCRSEAKPRSKSASKGVAARGQAEPSRFPCIAITPTRMGRRCGRAGSVAFALEIALGLRVLAAGLVDFFVRRRGSDQLCLFPDTRYYWELGRMIHLAAQFEIVEWNDIPHFSIRTPGYPLFSQHVRVSSASALTRPVGPGCAGNRERLPDLPSDSRGHSQDRSDQRRHQVHRPLHGTVSCCVPGCGRPLLCRNVIADPVRSGL